LFDVLITGGEVVDGTGAASRKADVAIEGDRIAAIGNLAGASARRTIDATGKAVSPGFIDTHVHSDGVLLGDPQHACGLRQGVTTEILGQDGLSYAPLSSENLKAYRWYLKGLNGDSDVPWDWSSVAEFRARFNETVAINTAYLIPHGAIRLETVGWRDVPLSPDEIKKAQRLIAQGMEEGAVGFSTGLSYYPCTWSTMEEITEFCKALVPYDGVYVTHLRSAYPERGHPQGGVYEALEIGRRSGARLHYSHFRTGPHNAGAVERLMAPIDEAIKAGQPVTLELYPYPAGSGYVIYCLPGWVNEGGPAEIMGRLSDPATRQRIVAEMTEANEPGWADNCLTYLPSAKNQRLEGMSFGDAARLMGTSIAEMLCQVLLDEELVVGFRGSPPMSVRIWDQVNRDGMELLSLPYYMVGSDAIHVGSMPHPRAYGCFARFLGRFRRKYGTISLEAMVRRMSALPADTFRLKNRGYLKEGYFADVVVFDPDTLIDTATFEDPRSLAQGVSHVLVNGKLAVDGGRCTGTMAGRAIP